MKVSGEYFMSPAPSHQLHRHPAVASAHLTGKGTCRSPVPVTQSPGVGPLPRVRKQGSRSGLLRSDPFGQTGNRGGLEQQAFISEGKYGFMNLTFMLMK